MIAIDCQPVSIIDHKGFKSLVGILEPKYQLPSRKYFSETVIPSIALRIRVNIASQLQKGAEYVSFTSDAWSSDVNSDSLLGFTAHWVDSDFHRQSACATCSGIVRDTHRRVYCYEDHQNAGRVEYSFVSGSRCYQGQWV